MKTKSIKQKLKEFFFDNPTMKMRVRQIERSVKAPLPSVIRYAKELENEGILQSAKIANIKVYSADRSSKTFLLEKRLHNLKKVFDSGLTAYLIEQYSNPAIILFGSYSKGEDTESSDIDLYIETASKKSINLKVFEKNLGRKIQLFIYPCIKQIPSPTLANNILNGVNLNGFVEVFK